MTSIALNGYGPITPRELPRSPEEPDIPTPDSPRPELIDEPPPDFADVPPEVIVS